MRKKLIITFLLLGWSTSQSCTTVFWNNNPQAKVVARSVDLFTPDLPKIKVFPRGVERHGEAGKNSLGWKSKYGSVVVTEFNSSAVSDGINEHGLAAHLLYLTGSTYEKRNVSVPALSNTLWAQYILDNFKTVNEAVSAIDQFQIVETVVFNQKWPLHLNIQDPTGDAAVIEFIDGKKKIYHGPQYTIMTNEPAYAIQLENLKRYKAFGGALSLPGDSDPLSRFVRVATYLKTLPTPKNIKDTVAGVLSVIRTAMVPFGAIDTSGNKTEDAWPTRWVSVADLTKKTYYFSSTTTPSVIWLDLKSLDFEGKTILSLDPNDTRLVGDVKQQLHVDKA
ncbi:linear amide C-N hydrolase [Legionella jordanis]|uniref:Choloylglycine hydrolase n=1 Tax=Legionella jordanis TaxID=456 RepID=A0A0W0V8C1_9GAMM|nr:linear amide C-N hydrolase [Legionella jordanis]KTD16389.1 choloylglycine hydrolase [Legionella jordanis]RMX04406.1 linear amide C-N hydrolase [Legionella jordanis]VEH12150.1 choloylglycine hydrolase [Legionella jordanis]